MQRLIAAPNRRQREAPRRPIRVAASKGVITPARGVSPTRAATTSCCVWQVCAAAPTGPGCGGPGAHRGGLQARQHDGPLDGDRSQQGASRARHGERGDGLGHGRGIECRLDRWAWRACEQRAICPHGRLNVPKRSTGNTYGTAVRRPFYGMAETASEKEKARFRKVLLNLLFPFFY